MIFLFFILFFIFFCLPFVYRVCNQLNMQRRCRKKGYVVLTYDDGPSIEMTPDLLDLLECSQTRATFFILGSQVDGSLPIIKRMALLGHEIGSHGYGHLNAWKTTPWAAIRDINMGVEALSKAHIHCKIFRPPYGKLTTFTLAVVLAKKMKGAWWTFVSGDTCDLLPDPYFFSEKVIKHGGGVVLMHDFHKSNLRKEFVLEVTSQLIDKSRKHGLEIKTLREIF